MDWNGKQVLIIDDEAPTRWLLALLFRDRGAEVHLAPDAQSGLQMVHDQHPHLVILDILMPGMNGWEVLQILRKTSDVPVVVLTSTSNGESEARCLDAGADDHVAKPFDGDVLLARCWAPVRRYLNLSVDPPAPNGYNGANGANGTNGANGSLRSKPKQLSQARAKNFAVWRSTG